MNMIKLLIISATSFFITNAADLANSLLAETDSWETIEFTKDTRPHWLLSLDGEGFPAIANLQAIVRLEQLTGKSVVDLFDGIVARSFSGVIACMLTMPDPYNPTRPKYSAEDVLNIIESRAGEICAPNIFSFGGTLGNHYQTWQFKSFLSDIFGKNTLKNRLLPTAIVAADLKASKPHIITTADANDFYTKDLVMASAAFPGFYDPQNVKPIGSKDSILLGDGYSMMVNPAKAGIALIETHYKVTCNDIYVLSLCRRKANNGQLEPKDENIVDLKGRYYRFDLSIGKSCFYSLDTSQESVEIQNMICDFEATAEKIKDVANDYVSSRNAQRLTGMKIKHTKPKNEHDVWHWMNSIL